MRRSGGASGPGGAHVLARSRPRGAPWRGERVGDPQVQPRPPRRRHVGQQRVARSARARTRSARSPTGPPARRRPRPRAPSSAAIGASVSTSGSNSRPWAGAGLQRRSGAGPGRRAMRRPITSRTPGGGAVAVAALGLVAQQLVEEERVAAGALAVGGGVAAGAVAGEHGGDRVLVEPGERELRRAGPRGAGRRASPPRRRSARPGAC